MPSSSGAHAGGLGSCEEHWSPPVSYWSSQIECSCWARRLFCFINPQCLETLHYFLPGLQAFPLLVSVLGWWWGRALKCSYSSLGRLVLFAGFWEDKFSTHFLDDRHALDTALVSAEIGSSLSCLSSSFILLFTLVCRDRLCFLFPW